MSGKTLDVFRKNRGMVRIMLLCFITALATLSPANADDDFKYNLTITINNGIWSNWTAPMFVNSGCGGDNQKCSCTVNGNQLVMSGQGTSGTATGLDFQCDWWLAGIVDGALSTCTCRVRIDIPHTGDNGIWVDCPCAPQSSLGLVIGCSGHDFNQQASFFARAISDPIQMPGELPKGGCQ